MFALVREVSLAQYAFQNADGYRTDARLLRIRVGTARSRYVGNAARLDQPCYGIVEMGENKMVEVAGMAGSVEFDPGIRQWEKRLELYRLQHVNISSRLYQSTANFDCSLSSAIASDSSPETNTPSKVLHAAY